jgi:hypothetical protein
MTTYYQAALGLGLPWIVRNDLGTMPDNNDDPILVKTRELFSSGSEQKFFDNDFHAYTFVDLGTQGKGCVQAFVVIPFKPKISTNLRLIFERPDPLFHLLDIEGGPIWIGVPTPTSPPYNTYPPYGPNAARVCDSGHNTLENKSMSLLLPWPNTLVPGQTMPMQGLIDANSNPPGPSRMWILAE